MYVCIPYYTSQIIHISQIILYLDIHTYIYIYMDSPIIHIILISIQFKLSRYIPDYPYPLYLHISQMIPIKVNIPFKIPLNIHEIP